MKICSFNPLAFTDLEYLIIIMVLMALFLFSLHKTRCRRQLSLNPLVNLSLSKEMSVLVKAMACVMILMSHYATRTLGGGLPKSVSYYVAIYASNVALVWFMFVSGYGLSLKSQSEPLDSTITVGMHWINRLGKVYFPFLFICCLHTLFFILPDSSISGGGKVLYAIGLADEWYVICIIYFYTLYYLSLRTACLFRTNQTVILAIFMLVYYAIAYYVYGEAQAHYYRFPLAFMAGHLVALRSKNPKYISWIVSILMMMTLFPLEFHYTKVYVVSFLILVIAGLSDKIYEIKASCMLYRLGIISYFFYLTHERFGFRVLELVGVKSCVLWIMVTILIAACSKYMYDKIHFK